MRHEINPKTNRVHYELKIIADSLRVPQLLQYYRYDIIKIV